MFDAVKRNLKEFLRYFVTIYYYRDYHGQIVRKSKELLLHPPYFLDLGLCKFISFLNPKKSVSEQKSELNEEVISTEETDFPKLQIFNL